MLQFRGDPLHHFGNSNYLLQAAWAVTYKLYAASAPIPWVLYGSNTRGENYVGCYAPIDICLRFAIFSIEMFGYYAKMQLFREMH